MFETLLVRGGQVHALPEHLARLEHSVRALYGLPLTAPELDPILTRLEAAAAAGEPLRARIDATPRSGRLALSLTTSPAPAGAAVTLAPLVVPGGLGAHKWQDRGLVDAAGTATGRVPLILDDTGEVLEAAWANVWLVHGDELVTPPADGRLLPGVTRGRLLQAAPQLGLRAVERPVTLGDLAAADGVLLTSSLRLAVAATLEPGSPRAPGGPSAPDEPPAATVSTLAARLRAALYG